NGKAGAFGTRAGFRDDPITSTPSAANASPTARPRPRDAPVMTASFPLKSSSGSKLSSGKYLGAVFTPSSIAAAFALLHDLAKNGDRPIGPTANASDDFLIRSLRVASADFIVDLLQSELHTVRLIGSRPPTDVPPQDRNVAERFQIRAPTAASEQSGPIFP